MITQSRKPPTRHMGRPGSGEPPSGARDGEWGAVGQFFFGASALDAAAVGQISKARKSAASRFSKSPILSPPLACWEMNASASLIRRASWRWPEIVFWLLAFAALFAPSGKHLILSEVAI